MFPCRCCFRMLSIFFLCFILHTCNNYHVDFFTFILFGVYSAFWICSFSPHLGSFQPPFLWILFGPTLSSLFGSQKIETFIVSRTLRPGVSALRVPSLPSPLCYEAHPAKVFFVFVLIFWLLCFSVFKLPFSSFFITFYFYWEFLFFLFKEFIIVCWSISWWLLLTSWCRRPPIRWCLCLGARWVCLFVIAAIGNKYGFWYMEVGVLL